MSSTYSDDEFELTAGSLSAAVSADDSGPNTQGSHHDEEGDDQGAADETQEGASSKLTVVLPKESVGADGNADVSDAGYSSFEDDDSSLPLISPSFTVGERDGRTTKQKYLDLKQKTATVWEEANALAQLRSAEELKLRLQAQQAKEAWHERIHRRYTELEWHRKLSAKTALSVIDMALNREAWTRGMLSARATGTALDKAFCSAFDSLQVRASAHDEAALAAERERAETRAEACKTVWDASRFGVPVRTLRELMEKKIDQSSCVAWEGAEEDGIVQAGQSIEFHYGIVDTFFGPTPGVRQEIEAHVPHADRFYVAFDAASNATMGMGKVTLQEFNARDPAVFFPRGPYNDSPGEAHLPGVNGEPPMRVEGSSVLVMFSASYWAGGSTAGQDYGWRLVCFTAKDDDDAKASVDLAKKAADRAAAVDAVNDCGETSLHVASFEGNVAAVRYLLSVDADPNSAHTASGYNTPLHEAARSGSLAVTRLLLKSSANVLAVNSHGDHPLHVACREGRLDIARRLLAHDSDWATVAARNHAGLRPSEVVIGCSALKSLVEQAEVNAAAAISNAAAGGTATSNPPPPSSLKTKPPQGQHSSMRRGGDPTRRRRNKAGLVARTSSEDASARALLSGGILPRWARLARPLDGEERRQRGPLDGRERRHNRLPRVGGSAGAGAVDADDPILSEGSEAQSFAGWSGTSYGASLADSDFEIPDAGGFPGDTTGGGVVGATSASSGRTGCKSADG
eukprot:g5866.t1